MNVGTVFNRLVAILLVVGFLLYLPVNEVKAEVPSITPLLPPPGSVYGYSPSYVSVSTNGFLIHTFDGISFTIDDVQLTNIGAVEGSVRAHIDFSLSDGVHEVRAIVPDGTTNLVTSWSFTVDRSSASAIHPTVQAVYPLDGAILGGFPDHIAAWVNFTAPDPRMMNVSIDIDGKELPASIFGETEQLVDVPTTGLLLNELGEHTVKVAAVWDGGEVHDWTWSFTVTGEQTSPTLSPAYPSDGSLLSGTPPFVEALFDPGNPTATVTSVTATLDGESIAANLLSDNHVRADVTTVMPSGEHRAMIQLQTTRGTLTAEWNFTTLAYILPGPDGAQLASYNYQDKYRLLLPINWTISEDSTPLGQTTGKMNITAYGPSHDGFTANVVVQDGVDPSVSSDQQAMMGWVEQTLATLRTNGYNASIYQGAQLIGSNDLVGVTFSVLVASSSSTPFVQRIGLTVDEASHHYFVVVCSASYAAYPLYDNPFFFMAVSIDPSRIVTLNGEQMAEYQYGYEFTVLAPRGWALNENQTIQGREFNLIGIGPVINGFATNFNLQMSEAPDATGSESELYGLALSTVQELHGAGQDVASYEDPTFFRFGNCSGIVFSLKWESPDIVQKIAIVINVTCHKVWVFTFSASEGAYEPYSPLFNTMVLSLGEADSAPANPGGNDENNDPKAADPGINGGFGKDVLIGGVIIGVIATIIALIASMYYVRRK